ncbi:MAG: nicotinamide-nucleotide amidohydrolase family protein [Anaerolineae bacterium]|nr:nicotinamide-nucleotide amidohydrolase family protein [Anaerolineae bacterium]
MDTEATGPADILSLARETGELLRSKGLTLAVAESCTGGAIGDAITNIPGSSGYFLGGVIAYANIIKERLLGVPREILEAHGAVSPAVAVAMAEGARRALGADLALAATGIAGPGGATTKPVGLVYVALAAPGGVRWQEAMGEGDRLANKRGAVRAALQLLHAYLLGAKG